MISTNKLREAVFFSVFLKQITFLMAIRMTGSGGGLKQQPPSVCKPDTRFYHRLLPSYWHLLSEPCHYSITCSWLRKVPAAKKGGGDTVQAMPKKCPLQCAHNTIALINIITYIIDTTISFHILSSQHFVEVIYIFGLKQQAHHCLLVRKLSQSFPELRKYNSSWFIVNWMWLMMLSIFFTAVKNQLTEMRVGEIIWWQSCVHFNCWYFWCISCGIKWVCWHRTSSGDWDFDKMSAENWLHDVLNVPDI